MTSQTAVENNYLSTTCVYHPRDYASVYAAPTAPYTLVSGVPYPSTSSVPAAPTAPYTLVLSPIHLSAPTTPY